MITKIHTGGIGSLAYVQSSVGVRGHIIDKNPVGESINELKAEYKAISLLRPRVSRNISHISISIGENDKLNDDQWRSIAHTFMQRMGYNDTLYYIVRHTDTPSHDHIHLVCSNIRFDGSLVNSSHNYRRAEQIMRDLENEYNLTTVLPSNEASLTSLSFDQFSYFDRTGDVPVKAQLQDILTLALARKPNPETFINELLKHGVHIKLHTSANTGKVFGMSFELDGVPFKGSQLGRNFTFSKINNQFNYENENRDITRILAETYQRAGESIEETSRRFAEDEYRKHSGTLSHHAPDRQRTARSNPFHTHSNLGIKGKPNSAQTAAQGGENVPERNQKYGDKYEKTMEETGLHQHDSDNHGQHVDSGSHILDPLLHNTVRRQDEDDEEFRTRKKRKNLNRGDQGISL